MRMKVGLYLENRDIADVDLTEPEKGNPGVGGTQFMFVCMPYYFKKNVHEKVKFTWYTNETGNLPDNIGTKRASTPSKAAKKAEEDECDIFVWRPTNDEEGREFLDNINSFNLKIIAWAHNTPNVATLNELFKAENVKRFVCVGQEQLDGLRDHRIINKAAKIYNGIDPTPYQPQGIIEHQKTVVFLGSLVPAKGFHQLAKVWPRINTEVPEAKLVVIGSGKLYNRNQSLGRWGIAEETYEKEYIRPYLSNENGEVADSVEFKGVLGREKIPIMQRAQVGVVNPTGKTETFGLSAVEFQSAGTPVVTGAYKAWLDTVEHKKTGLLGRGDEDLVDNIVYLLKNDDVAYEYGQNGIEYVKEKFSHEKINKQWLSLFKNVVEGKSNKVEPIKQYPLNDLKILRELVRLTRKYFPPLRHVPSPKELKPKIKAILQIFR
ncbi:glycosyltransferase family 4 protein [Candidatus Bipolaricaulota bacterium]|nr:glycosyltransferase family 4 protein [Candidatus Bipolaricaulota bacterium]